MNIVAENIHTHPKEVGEGVVKRQSKIRRGISQLGLGRGFDTKILLGRGRVSPIKTCD